MPQIDTNIWTDIRALFTGLNNRTGTSAITDTDYTNFAPFKTACYAGEPNEFILYNLLKNDKLSLNTGIDESICYVGMYNSDLPQLNIHCFDTLPYSTQDNPAYKTDNAQIQSFILTDLMSYHLTSGWAYGGNIVTNKDFTYYNNRLWLWRDGLEGDYPFLNPISTTNPNGLYQIYTSYGIKTLILEINVAYKTGNGTYYPQFARSTLAEYAAQTTAWREEHPILKAYCLPYIRDNVNGTYEHTAQYFWNNGVQYKPSTVTPIYTLPLISQVDNYPDILTYTYTLTSEQTTNGCFCLYGDFNDENAVTMASVAETGGIMAVLMGCNRGELKSNAVAAYRYYWLELDGSDDNNIDWLRRAAAAYGLFFCDDIGTLANAGQDLTRWIDNNMCLGTIDDNGRTNGDYTRGTQNVLQRQFDWTDTTQSNYDPSLPPVPENQYDNTTIFNSIGDSATMFKRYVLNGSNVEQLGRDLFKIVVDSAIDNPKYDDYATVINASFLVSDPLDSIISLQRYPMAIPHGSSAVENIKLGTNTCAAIGYPMSKTAYEYAFQGKKILPRFGDSFLDYEPYTKFEMYIPFCGTVELSPRDILNRDLSARLVVDYSTGTCTGYILSDNLVIETLNGNIAINIPVAGIDSATIQGNISNAVANSRSAYNNKMTAAFGLAKSMVNPFSWSSGKQVGALGAAINAEYAAETANYSLEHIPAAPHTIGSASPCGAWAIDLKCRLIIYYPTGEVLKQVEGLPAWDPLKLAVYGMSTGFYTAEPAQISSFTSGLLCAQNPILNSMTTNSQAYPASSQELEMIRAAIADGIIL